jgi:hypothetical protein
VEKFNAILAREFIIEDENAHTLKMGSGSEGGLGAAKSLDDVLLSQKGVEGAADVRVVFHHDQALIFDMARHGFKISRHAIIARRI